MDIKFLVQYNSLDYINYLYDHLDADYIQG